VVQVAVDEEDYRATGERIIHKKKIYRNGARGNYLWWLSGPVYTNGKADKNTKAF